MEVIPSISLWLNYVSHKLIIIEFIMHLNPPELAKLKYFPCSATLSASETSIVG